MEFLYDLDGHAVTMLDASTGGWDIGEIYAGPRHLATYSYSTTNFFHPDWLGTKRAMSNVSGAVSQTCTNLPFGDGPQCTGTTEWGYMHFTDDYHDSEDNLEHTLFRQYSSGQGRWMRPDPYSGSMDFGNPQSLNRYSYVTNNPTNAMDPLGLEDGNQGGPFGAAACTLLSGTGDEAFGCAGINSITRSGGGFSLGILGPGFGGGFSGIPIPGCLLPGECSITLPNPGFGGVFPGDPCSAEFGCNGASTFFPNEPLIVYPSDAQALLDHINFLVTGLAMLIHNRFNGPLRQVNLMGTRYCGPGGQGDPVSPVDIACKKHDDCYDDNKVTISDNFDRNLPPAKASALQSCNQQLCDSERATNSKEGREIVRYFSMVGDYKCH
jgi:RHS repeat-associated protein